MQISNERLSDSPLTDSEYYNSVDVLRNNVLGCMHALNENIKKFDNKHKCGGIQEASVLRRLSESLLEVGETIKRINKIV
jgi:hypothetical protein